MNIMTILQGILSFALSGINLLFTFILAFVVGFIALSKGRSFWLWGIASFIFPWLIFIIIFMPRKYPKFTSSMNDKEAFRGKNPVVASIMALAAIVAKSDGNVSREEIANVKKFVSSNFRLTGVELDSYSDAFEYGKNHPEEYREFVRIINHYYRRKEIHLAIAYLLVSTAMQNGEISQNEDTNIRNILRELGLSEYEYQSIKNSFVNGNAYTGNQYAEENRQENLIKKYSKILGVDENATLAEIKKAYRKNVKEYHPDKMASKGMPDEYMEYTNKKIVEINEAYDYLKKVKV